MTYSCAAASLGRDEPAVGSASTVRAFLLVENAGPWGVDALRDARLPEDVKAGLRAHSARAGVRVLLVRRHRGAESGPGLRVFAAWADAALPWLETATLQDPAALLDLDLDALSHGRSPGLDRTDRPVFGVCTHGRHDSCCATLGRPTAAALTRSHPEETWDVSHVGGDRFAANVLVLPEGLYYGRVSAAAAPGLAARHLAGHLDLDLLRGRSGFAFPVQVAEVAVRRTVGETRTAAVRLVGRPVADPADPALLTVRLDVDGTPYDVVVRRSQTREEHQLTCRARRSEVAPTYEVRSVGRV
jgi:hypothetical protein